MIKLFLFLGLSLVSVQVQGCAAPYVEVNTSAYDLWETSGNTNLLQALNAALYEILPSNEWAAVHTALGLVTPVATAKMVSWPDKNIADGSFKLVLDTGKIRFGSTLNTPPMVTNISGCISGKEVELSNMIAAKFSQQYQQNITAAWIGIHVSGDFWFDISYALSGSDRPAIDVILSTVTKTSGRVAGGKAVFTNSYFDQKYGLVASAVKGKDITLGDLNSSTTTVAVGKGTTNEEFMKSAYPGATLVTYGSFTERKAAILSNAVHVGIGDEALMYDYTKTTCPTCRFLGAVGSVTQLAMAVRPDSQPQEATDAPFDQVPTEANKNANFSTVAPGKKADSCTVLLFDKKVQNSGCRQYCGSGGCYECFHGRMNCDYMEMRNEKGRCCMNNYCCETQRCTKYSCTCLKSVRRQCEVKCSSTTYSVKIEAQGKKDGAGDFVTDRNVYIDCGRDSFCQNKIGAKFTPGSKHDCAIENGRIFFLNVDTGFANRSCVSSISILLLLVGIFFN